MRFYFNVRDGKGLILDAEGSDLPGMVAARLEACASAREFAMDDLRAGKPVDERAIEITDGKGTLLESVPVHGIVIAH